MPATIAGVVALAAACGAGQTAQLQASSMTPAAEAKVTHEATKDGNTKLDVEVKHLAAPEQVASDAKVYVVWAVPRFGDDKPRNLGSLQVDADRKGRMETVTSLKYFGVQITPEASPTIDTPTHAPVLTGEVQR